MRRSMVTARRSLRWLICAAAAMGVGAAAPCGPSAQAEEVPVITLGASISETGSFRENGTYLRDGYRLAIRTINDAGGVEVGGRKYKLALKYYDDGSDARRSAAVVRRLIDSDGVRFVLSPYSSTLTGTVQPLVERRRVPMVIGGAAAARLFRHDFRYSFGVTATTERYFDPLFKMLDENAADKLGKQPSDMRVAVAMYKDPFSQDIREDVLQKIEDRRMRLVIDDELEDDLTDLSMTVERIGQLRPDIVIISGRDKGAVSALKALSAAKVHVPVLALSHCDSARVAEKLGAASEKVFCPLQWHSSLPYRDDMLGSAQEFAAAFKRQYGYAPTAQAAQGAAAVEIFAAAFAKCDRPTPDQVRRELAAMKSDTFFGPVVIDRTGRNAAKPIVLSQVRNGKHVLIAPERFKAAEPVLLAKPR